MNSKEFNVAKALVNLKQKETDDLLFYLVSVYLKENPVNADDVYAEILSKVMGYYKNDVSDDKKIVKTEKHKEESKASAFVPASLKEDAIESFFQALEKKTIVNRKGEEQRLLDRSSLPWVFATKMLASYVAHILQERFSLLQAFSDIEKVAGYKPRSLRSL